MLRLELFFRIILCLAMFRAYIPRVFRVYPAYFLHVLQANSAFIVFKRTKMRLKDGMKIELQRDISQVVYRLFAVRGPYLMFFTASMPFPLKSAVQNKTTNGPTDGPTDGSTDGWTHPHIEMHGRI